jgi:hypothetical protein
LYPIKPKPPPYSPTRGLKVLASLACNAWRWRRRLPPTTSFNGSRSRTLMLSLFCFFISGAPF